MTLPLVGVKVPLATLFSVYWQPWGVFEDSQQKEKHCQLPEQGADLSQTKKPKKWCLNNKKSKYKCVCKYSGKP